MGRLRGLDLFSGIGGISLALSPWVETVAYCEREPYAQAVLLERMQDGTLDSAPLWTDVTTLSREILDTEIDIIFGGFPCQDISVAGTGKGLEGERSGLFFEIMRLAKEFQPSFIFLENVPAITGRGLDTVAEEITALGYDCRWGVLSAYDVGAPHKRERWWLLAYANSKSCGNERKSKRPENREMGKSPTVVGDYGETQYLAHAHGSGKLQPRRRKPEQRKRASNGCASGNTDSEILEVGKPCENGCEQPSHFGADWWESEPNVGRVANGIPNRPHRIKALGNSVVPQAAREAFKRLMGVV